MKSPSRITATSGWAGTKSATLKVARHSQPSSSSIALAWTVGTTRVLSASISATAPRITPRRRRKVWRAKRLLRFTPSSVRTRAFLAVSPSRGTPSGQRPTSLLVDDAVWVISLRQRRGAFKRCVGQDVCGAQGPETRRRVPSAPWLSMNRLRRALFSFRGVSDSSAGLQTPSATVSLHRDIVPTPAGRDLLISHSPPLHSKQRSGTYHHPDLDRPPQPRH